MKKKKGFTLLELLVVVLIIGILAGIALPQYQRAKEKVEAAELLTNVKALHEAQHRYFLVNGTFAESFDDLDISFGGFERDGCPNFTNWPKSDCLSKGRHAILISTLYGIASYAAIGSGRYQYGSFMYQEEENSDIPANTLLCHEYLAKGFCSDLLKCNLISTVGNNTYYSCSF